MKLSVEVAEDEFATAIDAAFRRLAHYVRIPGFRPGKAPRRMVEAKVGAAAAREEALREALPGYFEQAVADNELNPVAPPEIDLTAGKEEGPILFNAMVEVVPHLALSGYESLRVVLPIRDATDDEVEGQVDRLREQFGELQTVNRPAGDGDNVLIDRKVYRHDQTLVSACDELFEIGRETAGPELDVNLRGAKAGDILRFNSVLADDPESGDATFQVLVKEVKEKVLPAADDEWAADASEFETMAELRANVRDQMMAVRKLQGALTARDRLMEALGELVTEEVPSALVMAEMERRVRLLANRLAERQIDLPDYLAARGLDQDALLDELRGEAAEAVKVDLALGQVALREHLEVTDADVEEELARLAERTGRKPAAVRRKLESKDSMVAVRSGIRKSKAVEWLLVHCELVDEEGKIIQREAIFDDEASRDDGLTGAAATAPEPETVG